MPAPPDPNPELTDLGDGALVLYRDLYPAARASRQFDEIHAAVDWAEAEITLFGRRVTLPRLSAWYGERPYTYSNLNWPARPGPAVLAEVRQRVETLAGQRFNGVLANLYRDGADSMGWHSDDEPELGPAPVVASVSFGVVRRFKLRRKDNHRIKHEIELPSNSLLVMAAGTQAHWQHAVPKTKKKVGPRINLTFRLIAD